MSIERPHSDRPWRRWTLRCLLLLFIPVCAALAVYGHAYRQKQLAIEAFQRMSSLGVNANLRGGLLHSTYIFKNGNVTDADLEAFVPAFNGYAPTGFGRIESMQLNGSKVSAEAVKRFRRAVPDCDLQL